MAYFLVDGGNLSLVSLLLLHNLTIVLDNRRNLDKGLASLAETLSVFNLGGVTAQGVLHPESVVVGGWVGVLHDASEPGLDEQHDSVNVLREREGGGGGGGRYRDVGHDGSWKGKDIGGSIRTLATSRLCNDHVLHVLITYRDSGCMVNSATSGGNVLSNMVTRKQ